MSRILVFCLLLVAVVAFTEDTYDSTYDNFDIRPLVENPRTLKNYGNCFLDQGPCTPEALEFKKAIPEALKTICGKCTPKQRELVRVVIEAFKTKQPEIWNDLVQKLDPTGKYSKAFKEFLTKTK